MAGSSHLLCPRCQCTPSAHLSFTPLSRLVTRYEIFVSLLSSTRWPSFKASFLPSPLSRWGSHKVSQQLSLLHLLPRLDHYLRTVLMWTPTSSSHRLVSASLLFDARAEQTATSFLPCIYSILHACSSFYRTSHCGSCS
jgi:hypothetical protein